MRGSTPAKLRALPPVHGSAAFITGIAGAKPPSEFEFDDSMLVIAALAQSAENECSIGRRIS